MFLGGFLGKLLGVPSGHISGIGEGYAILLTSMLIVIGWYIVAARNVIQFRRDNAHRYIVANNKELFESVRSLGKYLKPREKFPEFDITSNSFKERDALMKLLTALEITATDVAFGLASEKYIRANQASLFLNVYDCSRDFIRTIRKRQPTAFRNFEDLCIRMKFSRFSFFRRVFEALLNKPFFRLSRCYFHIKYALGKTFYDLNANYLCEDLNTIDTAFHKLEKLLLCGLVVFCMFAVAIVHQLLW